MTDQTATHKAGRRIWCRACYLSRTDQSVRLVARVIGQAQITLGWSRGLLAPIFEGRLRA